MVALPGHITLECPVCSAPFDLPLKCGKQRVVESRLVADLSLDTSPMQGHLKAEHAELLVRKPTAPNGGIDAAVVATGGITVHVHQAVPTDDTALVRRAARLEDQSRVLGRSV